MTQQKCNKTSHFERPKMFAKYVYRRELNSKLFPESSPLKKTPQTGAKALITILLNSNLFSKLAFCPLQRLLSLTMF